MINSVHHFEIFTNSSKKLLNYFTKGLDFELIGKNYLPNKVEQNVIRSNNAYFLITSLNDDLNDQEIKKSFNKAFENDQYQLNKYLTQGKLDISFHFFYLHQMLAALPKMCV
jgi:hypothetical protein